ncbi:MAG: hypothetical protein Q9M26_06780 [Mariprofundales bacterium]|nr:hypothetical protein [Mariprofundales bacterium]
MISTAIITNGLIQQARAWQLHSELTAWCPSLLRRHQRWFHASAHNPLSALARLTNTPAARLLMENNDEPGQWWVVSPWHGQTMRDRVRLLPAAMLPWQEQDGRWLQEQLHPLLDPLAMELKVLPGGSMVMHCRTPLDVAPAPFPQLEQDGLSNRHPEGSDGGALMRLLAEIEMLLHQNPAPHRKDVPEIHGIWLWGQWLSIANDPISPLHLSAMIGGNVGPQLLHDADNARVFIGEVEEMGALLPRDGFVPKRVVAIGADHAICFHGRGWRLGDRSLHAPTTMPTETELWRLIGDYQPQE